MQATDRRRFTAPEGAQPITYRPSPSNPTASSSTKDPSTRADNRSPDQVRPIFLQPGLVTEAAGSAYIEAGRTKLICAVYGPKPTALSTAFNPKAKLNVEVKFAPFSSGVRRFVPGKDTEASTLAATLHQSLLPSIILETMPKSQIDLFVTILESDGWDGDVAMATTAASVALAEAGIQLYGLTIGLCAASHPSFPTTSPLLDPTRDEAFASTSFFSIALMPALGSVTNLRLTGTIDPTTLEIVLEKCLEVSKGLHGVAREALLQKAEAEELERV
ncbi:hypothetical protein JCM16303_000759 [Sporobolomyces ruberrimus]